MPTAHQPTQELDCAVRCLGVGGFATSSFLLKLKFRITVQSRRLVFMVLQLAHNMLFICNMFIQSKCREVSCDAK